MGSRYSPTLKLLNFTLDIHDGNYRYLTECGISRGCSPGGRNSSPSALGASNSLDSYQTMTLITKLRKLEGIGVDAVRAEFVQLIHQSLKDAEQDLEVITISSCGTSSANMGYRIAITNTY